MKLDAHTMVADELFTAQEKQQFIELLRSIKWTGNFNEAWAKYPKKPTPKPTAQKTARKRIKK